MRNPVIYLVLLAALGTFACEQKVDVAAEEAAIQAAVQNENNAWEEADYERLAASWRHEPYVVHRTMGDKAGWDSLSVAYKNIIELRNKEPDNYKFEEYILSNFDIHIIGNAAFVIHDEHVKGVFAGEDISGDIKVIKHLVKDDGEWKLVTVF